MQDHRDLAVGEKPKLSDITELVYTHNTKHPGSVRRSDKAKSRAAQRRAKMARKGNR